MEKERGNEISMIFQEPMTSLNPVFPIGYDFFFQAEDGIRIDLVTGVQTCALPIFGAGEEERVVAGEPTRPRERVGRDRGVGVPDVRDVVHVVDRRREIERALRGGHAGFPDPERQAARASARTSFTATPASAARRWQSSNSGHAL